MESYATTATHRSGKGGSAQTRDSAIESIHSVETSAPIHGVKKQAEHLMDKACDAGHTLRRYPKLLVALLFVVAFLLGSVLTAGIQKVGIFGGSTHYVSSHWDRETSSAHHALDVILDHIKHPQYYRTEKSESYVHKARRNLLNIFEGILPSMARRGKEYGDDLYDAGRDVYDKATGRSWYDKLTGRGIVDKAADAKNELIHNVRRGVDQAKDAGYGLGHKVTSMAESVKDKIVSKNGHLRDPDQGSREGGSWFSGSWLGRGRDEAHIRDQRDDDEFGISTDKLRKIVRNAEREM